ncbi:PAS domain-containing methyl-accepting chemotaxis protein [Sneathiella sp.]|uniref:methyl-accepting chemotaxis protein n=1 Tax=Sneathiella sp. TaxID=1964365 RepID=UPI00263181B9|nr:PAS domain-containing methyl-accepting chemotaxis protein [Sneathiella sp.]MDF2367603.1 PAS domain-containing methyl-accepting chemotaxis protein [Sneathiella sp.]
MLFKREVSNALLDALNKSQAIIEFDMGGNILNANANFLSAMDYRLEEITGKHHSMFVDPTYASSDDYRKFWEKLSAGEYLSDEFKRFGKDGKEVWIQASYNPILNAAGKPVKVVKFATDITEQKRRNADFQGQVDAIGRSQAVIEFTLDGTILNANENFLDAMGYSLDDVKGRHHSMFVDATYAKSPEYRDFWKKLAAGEYLADEFPRVGKGGAEIWIQASYNPILDMNGTPVKVVKYATDVTAQKRRNADFSGQIDAIGKSQAIIEFEMDGTIRNANPNFLDAMGYSLEEITGKHHSMFVDPAYAASGEYKDFWEMLGQGEYLADEFQRFGKGGKEVWIRASYNPILDMNGKPFKVVKYATDVTEQKLQNADYRGQIDAIGKSQAVIEFKLDGTIIKANENFLGAMGYSLEEITGKHHSIFVDPAYAASDEYKDFWEKLRQGEYLADEFKRFDKGGNEIWIQASYNPILDMNGNPFKVVKFATNITDQMQARIQAGELSSDSQAKVQSVAGATQEMQASIQEISQNMNNSQQAVSDIVSKTDHAKELTARLQETSKSMESVVEIIREIAGKVNLLALNATIEAARAGEMGKGFAVVAGEVKTLATQTSKATDDIYQEIIAMQAVANDVVESNDIIANSTASVNEYVAAVASAIEEQSVVTNEISQNMEFFSTGITELNDCVKRLSNAG